MIDIHSHYLFEIDDGAKNMAMSLQMIDMAIAEGIDEAILTPHYYLPGWNSDGAREKFRVLELELAKQKINFTIHLGNELHLNEESVRDYIAGKVEHLGNSEYVLVELPVHRMYPFHHQLLYDIQLAGGKVILAHIERYPYLVDDTEMLKDMRSRACSFQISSRTLMNRHSKQKALKLILQGYVDIVATDAHNITGRRPRMAEARRIVEKNIDSTTAETLFYTNGRRIIQNQSLLEVDTEMSSGFIHKIGALFKR